MSTWRAAVTAAMVGFGFVAVATVANGQSGPVLASMPTARSGLGLAAANGKLYAIGGSRDGVDLDVVEEYDPATDTWRARAPMPRARRSFAVATAGNGRLYVVGGLLGGTTTDPIADVDEYDPVTDTWRARSPGPAVAAHGLTAMDSGNLLMVGGWFMNGGRPSGAWDSVIEFDADTDTWMARMILPWFRQNVGLAAPGDGKVYAVGGGPEPGGTGPVLIFDPAGGSGDGRGRWSQGAEYPVVAPAVAAVGGIVYAFKGEAVAAYDPTTNTWSMHPPLSVPRIGLAAVALGAAIYTVGGNDGSGDTGVVERYVVRAAEQLTATAIAEATEVATNGTRTPTPTRTQTTTPTITTTTTPSATPSPTPTSTPTPEYGVSINGGALFTNSTRVTLNISSRPFALGMQVSNDGGFADAHWEPVAPSRQWEITSLGSHVIPRTVYVRFQDPINNRVVTVSDDIVLDLAPPTGSVRVLHGGAARRAAGTAVTLELLAADDVSGVAAMQVAAEPTFCGAAWEPYRSARPWVTDGETVYARYRDHAGNVSHTYQDGATRARSALTRAATSGHRVVLPLAGRAACLD